MKKFDNSSSNSTKKGISINVFRLILMIIK